MFEIAAVFLVLTALLAYVNLRFVGLPMMIGVLVIALGLSLLLVGLDRFGLISGLHDYEKALLRSFDFSDVVMRGMLSLLLFAASLGVDLRTARSYRWQIAGLATVGTLVSTLVVAAALYWMLPLFGLALAPLHCLLFGALISPTDPVAVIGIMRKAGAPDNLETVMAGESLFNDGVGVVVFTLLVGVLASGQTPTVSTGVLLFLREAGGGLVFGAVLGYGLVALLRGIDSYEVEVLMTLAGVMGGYTLANHLHVSGPLAMVVAGVLVGNQGREQAMSTATRHHVDLFWELVDEMLNAVLFVLIGMEVVLIPFNHGVVMAGAGAIAATLLARWLTVGLPVWAWPAAFKLPAGSGRVLTWGGLRGGISVALALSLPPGPQRDLLLAFTYCVVVFSILVQGLSMGTVVRRSVRGGKPSNPPPPRDAPR